MSHLEQNFKYRSMGRADGAYLIFLLRQLSQARWVFVRFLLSLADEVPGS